MPLGDAPFLNGLNDDFTPGRRQDQTPFTPLSRQVLFPKLNYGLRPKAVSPASKYAKVTTIWEDDSNKENIPPPTLNKEDATLGEPKEGPEHDKHEKAGHDGSGKHVSSTTYERW